MISRGSLDESIDKYLDVCYNREIECDWYNPQKEQSFAIARECLWDRC